MWSIHNAIALCRRGLPTTAVCSSRFEPLVKATAAAEGFPDLAYVAIPHPIAENDVDRIRKKAEDAIEEIAKIVSMSGGRS